MKDRLEPRNDCSHEPQHANENAHACSTVGKPRRFDSQAIGLPNGKRDDCGIRNHGEDGSNAEQREVTEHLNVIAIEVTRRALPGVGTAISSHRLAVNVTKCRIHYSIRRKIGEPWHVA